MKRVIVIIAVILGVFFNMSGQQTKSYVTVYVEIYPGKVSSDTYVAILSGDIPSDMMRYYTFIDLGYSRKMDYCTCGYYGEVLNMLAKHGFTVEQMTQSSDSAETRPICLNILLSKPVGEKKE